MTAKLCGIRVVNTRSAHQADDVNRLLHAAGAIPIPYPCIAIAPPPDAAALDRALDRLAAGEFDWLALTSSNTIHALAQRWSPPTGLWKRTRVAAVGPATARAAGDLLDAPSVLTPPTHSGAALADAIPVRRGDRVLLPCSDVARSELAAGLGARGAQVESIVAYRTEIGGGGSNLPILLADGQIDAISFCSSSAVDGFVARLAAEGGELPAALALPVVCIGEPTCATAREHGFRHATPTNVHSLDALIATLAETMATQLQGGSRWR
jgi:uroporphyrinogen-III synthase